MTSDSAPGSSPAPFNFVRQSDSPLTLHEAVGQAIGAASTCWENNRTLIAGVFDSDRAADIAHRLIAAIENGECADGQWVANQHSSHNLEASHGGRTDPGFGGESPAPPSGRYVPGAEIQDAGTDSTGGGANL